MINKNELRIGNLVLIFGVVIEVTHLGETTLGYRVDDMKTSATYDALQPIPLTPEILGKCGFKHGMVKGVTRLRDEYDTEQPEGDTHFWDIKTNATNKAEGLYTFNLVKFGDGDIHFSNQWLRIPLQYLHQLQNLYMSLCGKELEINL